LFFLSKIPENDNEKSYGMKTLVIYKNPPKGRARRNATAQRFGIPVKMPNIVFVTLYYESQITLRSCAAVDGVFSGLKSLVGIYER
jgi:hypothetical protein